MYNLSSPSVREEGLHAYTKYNHSVILFFQFFSRNRELAELRVAQRRYGTMPVPFGGQHTTVQHLGEIIPKKPINLPQKGISSQNENVK